MLNGQAMIKVLEQAIEKVRSLSEERQRYAASVLEEIADAGDASVPLSTDERALVQEGLDDVEAGRIVAAADMERFWSRNRR